MKKVILGLLIMLSTTIFAQVDTGEIDRDGRIVYEKVFEGASVEVAETLLVDEDLYRIFDHQGVFRIGAQKTFNRFPWDMLVRVEKPRSLLFMKVDYEFVEKTIVITAKNTIDNLVFPLGVQYYIVVRYTKR